MAQKNNDSRLIYRTVPIKWQPINAISFLQRGNDAIRRAEEAVREGEFRLDLKSVRIVSPILHPGQVFKISKRVHDCMA